MKTIAVKQNIHAVEKQLRDLQATVGCTLPIEYSQFLLKSVELKPDIDYKLGQQYVNNQLTETLVFGRLYALDMVQKQFSEYNYFAENRIDLYDKTVLIGEDVNNGYFYLRVIDDSNYEIGYWDTDYIMSDYQEETDDNELINERMNPHNTYHIADTLSDFLNAWSLIE